MERCRCAGQVSFLVTCPACATTVLPGFWWRCPACALLDNEHSGHAGSRVDMALVTESPM